MWLHIQSEINVEINVVTSACVCACVFIYIYIYIYGVIQEESAILWEMIVCVILNKKVHMNMGPILNGYRYMVKRRYGPSCEH